MAVLDAYEREKRKRQRATLPKKPNTWVPVTQATRAQVRTQIPISQLTGRFGGRGGGIGGRGFGIAGAGLALSSLFAGGVRPYSSPINTAPPPASSSFVGGGGVKYEGLQQPGQRYVSPMERGTAPPVVYTYGGYKAPKSSAPFGLASNFSALSAMGSGYGPIAKPVVRLTG